jgi:hypothetical protein
MLWIATLAALSATSPAPEEQAAAPKRQAQAMVRIMRPATVRLGEGADGADQDPPVRRTTIRDRDGELRPAVLVEFS